jgi:hypothetical protein
MISNYFLITKEKLTMLDNLICVGNEIINPNHIAFIEQADDRFYVHFAIPAKGENRGHETRDYPTEAFIKACQEAGLAKFVQAKRR